MNSLNIFGNSGSMQPAVMQTPIAALADSLRSAIAGQGGAGFADGKVVRAAIATESFSADTQMELNTSIQNLRATISAAVKSNGGFEAGLSIAQESAAVAAGIMASSPMDFLRSPIQNSAKLASAAQGTNTTVIGHQGLSGAMELARKV